MYKVFINDKPIILTSSLKKENNFPIYIFKDIVIDEIIHKLNREKIMGINLYSSNLEEDWKLFLNKFNVISAAGGLVLNPKKEILFIFRTQKWDFPKGRIEKGESVEKTALREVEEECGITHLSIQNFLLKTYHWFYNGEHRLKETHWFLMHSDFKGKLTPQIEEGITKVVFKNEEETLKALKSSYANIQLVYEVFKKHKS